MFLGLKDVAVAQKLEKMIHSVIFDLLHPRTLLSITIQPLSLDGSVKEVETPKLATYYSL